MDEKQTDVLSLHFIIIKNILSLLLSKMVSIHLEPNKRDRKKVNTDIIRKLFNLNP
jgi:hypothetical protein